ncbi:hypothetical protein [Aurantiacibacter gilvus]|uniref:Uncharacterized protein n=1 Tax=Aurantiacibacter gilvus TaxID=3139141 RepID=A0ABU9IE23_9SPHN
MSIYKINLRKLIRMFFAPENLKVSLLRGDIRSEIAKAAGYETGGGDFYVPFWRDAKDHTANHTDLFRSVDSRIESNERRENLYPRLRDGFLLWWNERRRWTNEPFEEIPSPKGALYFEELGAAVKIENFLALRGSEGDLHFVYPYFSPNPELSEEGARLALWAIKEANLGIDDECIRVLDVMRGRSFSFAGLEFTGNERHEFIEKYQFLISDWESLWSEYE